MRATAAVAAARSSVSDWCVAARVLKESTATWSPSPRASISDVAARRAASMRRPPVSGAAMLPERSSTSATPTGTVCAAAVTAVTGAG
jgi:hypothetical protein